MTLDEVTAIYVGSTSQSAVYVGSTLVWPTTVTYVITSATMNYTDTSSSYILADGSNYAYVTGTVEVYRNGTLYQTLTDVTLTPTLASTTRFYVSGNYIYGYDLGTTVVSRRYTTVTVTYGTSDSYEVGYVYQQANTRTTTYTYEIVYGDSTTSTEYSDYTVSLTSSAYTSSSSACSASGGTATLTTSASHVETEVTETPWTKYRTPNYTYTSGSTSTGTTTVYDSGTNTEEGSSSTITDTPTLSISGTGFSLSSKTVTIASEGTTEYSSGRTGVVTATNESATTTVTLYQEANVVESTETIYDIYVAISYSGNLPATSATYTVNYRSRTLDVDTYTSGEEDSGYNAVSSTVSTTNCTASSSSVSGTGSFTITVTANGYSQRYIYVTLTAPDSSHADSDYRIQEAQEGVAATFTPSIGLSTGYIFCTMTVTDGTLSSTDVTGLVLNYTSTLAGTGTISLGSFTFEDGVKLRLSTKSYFLSGDSGTCYFSATTTGDVTDPTFETVSFEIA